MKNKNGFTLVELLAVIAILGIIITITVVSVSGVLKRSTNNSYDILKNEIKSAAQRYVADNINDFNATTINVVRTTNLFTKNLIDQGYLKELKDPSDKTIICYNNSNDPSTISNDSYIKVGVTKFANGNYKFNYQTCLVCNGALVGTCS